MERNSVEKLLTAGYIFIRKEDSTNTKCASGVKYIIKESKGFGAWQKLGEFPTKAARERKLKELLAPDTPYIMER